jgi:hypothetical protein
MTGTSLELRAYKDTPLYLACISAGRHPLQVCMHHADAGRDARNATTPLNNSFGKRTGLARVQCVIL